MTDTLEIIKCPACGEEMYKVYIAEKNINVDVCVNGCGGIFFDNREFKLFDEKHENADDIFVLLDQKTFEPVDESITRICPACGRVMVKNYSSIKKDIQVDDCYYCGGKFLDYGELNRIREEYETDKDRTNDVIKYLYDNVGSELNKAQAEGTMARADMTNADKLINIITYVKEKISEKRVESVENYINNNKNK